MSTPTYAEIAASFDLWIQYVDPSGCDTIETFEAMSVDEKIAFQVKCFGPESE